MRKSKRFVIALFILILFVAQTAFIGKSPQAALTAVSPPTLPITSSPTGQEPPPENTTCASAVAQGYQLYLPIVLKGVSAYASSSDSPPPVVSSADFAQMVTFLYTGPSLVQTGILTDTIDPDRVAVLRGRVCDRGDNPISNVEITILNHPEYGSTLTTADGMFNIVVNGGGLLTVVYEKGGYLSAQRQVQVPWLNYAWLPEIVLIPEDTQVTTIDLTAALPIQVAQGSPISDTDGSRQATLMIPQGTEAAIFHTDGTTETVTTLNLRLTEYTVGESGPEAMPAELPANSGYTYAVELSADEAIAKINGRDVLFNQPVIFYLENFLDFDVGVPVPMGYYDNDKGAWVASDSGVVLQILSITGGMANLDVDGDGVADTGAVLTDLGITDAERGQLASLYTAGQNLQRIQITHLSTWDANQGTRCKDNICSAPNLSSPQPPPPVDNVCRAAGSIIECQNQTLSEVIDSIGTPFRLYYQSSQVPGRKAEYTLDFPLVGEALPQNIRGIQLEVYVAGRFFSETYTAVPNQQATFTWDGMDAYGNLVDGHQLVTVRIGYSYELEYVRTDRFGYNGNGILITINPARGDFNLWQEWTFPLGTFYNLPTDLGGWSLDIHHTYDTVGKTLYLGSGEQRSAESLNFNIIKTVAGGVALPGSEIGDGGPATEAELFWPYGIAIAPDQGFYVADSQHHRIRYIAPTGVITTVAGIGVFGYSGDGLPATQAQLNSPADVVLAPDGGFYIADTNNHRIRRVGPDGIISTVAGTGTAGYNGDEALATEAQLNVPEGIALGPDGSLYIADTGNQRIRRVGLDGLITTVAGTGTWGYDGDGGPATQARLATPKRVAVGPDGALYITDFSNNRIRQVGPDGVITTVAGIGGPGGYNGDGIPATQAQLNSPRGLAIATDGSFYLVDNANQRVRLVGTDGIITTVAGNGQSAFAGDGGLAVQALLASPQAVAVAPDGSVYVSDGFNQRVRRVASALPAAANTVAIASEDGSELYVFDRNGRHLQTLHALTEAVLYTFGYDGNGRLLTITDGNNNVTTITRDSNGNPTGIVGPYGQVTSFTQDANGYLAMVSNPAGETFTMQYSDDGLLTSFTDPRGNISTFTYDALGRLAQDNNAAGGFIALDRNAISQSYTVTQETAMGRTTSYVMGYDALGNEIHRNTLPNGLQTEYIQGFDGSHATLLPDGSTTAVLLGPDPRWGMLSPLVSNITITTPAGLVATMGVAQTAVLTNTADPFSLTSLNETVTVNSRTFTSLYIATSQTFLDTTPEGRQFTVIIDEQGRPVLDQVAGLLATNYIYDGQGRRTSATQGSGGEVRTFTFTYYSSGYLATVTDPLNRTVSLTYDLAGRVTQQALPDGRLIGYSYDTNGNLTSITPPGRPSHTFSYNSVNLPTAYTPPDVLPGTDQTLYSYNLDGQLTQITRPDGETIQYGYDNAGRLATATIGRGTVGYAYHPTTGNLASIAAPGGINLAYSYDGFLLIGETWSGPVTGSAGYTYDNNFRVIASTVNSGNSISYQYDEDDLLTQAGALALNYNAQNSLLTGTTLGSVNDTWGYNGFGEPVAYTASYNATPLYDLGFTRDNLGRITQKVETIGGVTDTYGYSYDLAGRLIGVTKNGSTIATYTYDSNGNRLSFTGPGGMVNGTYDNQDRLLQYGSTSYTYTANGELASKSNSGQTTTYDYDELGNLTAVTLPDNTQITYLIDGQNRRIGKQINGTLVQGFLYEGQLRPIAELDSAGNVISRFIYGTHVNVPEYMVKNGTTYRLITDHLGSVWLVVNSQTGAVTQRLDYDEFGRVLQDTNPGFQPFGFAGGLYDEDAGLVRFGYRDYDAEIGRWIAKDPIRFESSQTNLFVYVNNDPMNGKDPQGLAEGSPQKCNPLVEYIKKTAEKWACKQAPASCCQSKKTSCYLAINPDANDFNPAPQQAKCEEQFQQCMSKIKAK